MPNSWRSILYAHLAPLVLFTALLVSLAAANYQAGTILSGWDNLHPEYDFSLNIERSLSAVWQEYQGLGLLGGMSHAADLTRQLWLWALSLVLPTELLRYSWVWLCWWLGITGAYSLGYLLLAGSRSRVIRVAAATSGALFYLLNLATVQYFYVPYESFSSFYAFLPWILAGVWWYSRRPNRGRALGLAVISLAAGSAFYVQTLFVVVFLVVAILLLSEWLSRRLSWRTGLLALLILVTTNLYWLLPSAYFTVTAAANTVESKVNRLATLESQLMNQSFGTPLNLMLLRGYWLDYQDVQANQYVYLMANWRSYYQLGAITVIAVSFWGLAVFGLLTSLRRQQHWQPAWCAVFVLATLMLTSGYGPLGAPFRWASEYLPLFGQIFRTAFTKWSIVAALLLAVGIAFAGEWLLRQAKTWQRGLAVSWVAVVGASLLILVWPAFQGDLIASTMRTRMPAAYPALFAYLRTQPAESRILSLPVADFWAWSFYDWGYRGSGFLWYGIRQPIVDRNFDVWSPANETLYQQLRTAIINRDVDAVQTLFGKYHLRYVLIDESLRLPTKPADALAPAESKELVTQAGAQLVWQQDHLWLYQVPTTVPYFLTAPTEFTVAAAETRFTRRHPVMAAVPSYVTPTATSRDLLTTQVTWPFAPLTKEKLTATQLTAGYVNFPAAWPETSPPPRDQAQELFIPPVLPSQPYQAYLTVLKEGERLRFQFRSSVELVLNETIIPVRQLPELTLPLRQPVTLASQVALTLDGQPLSITGRQSQQSSWVTLTAGQALELKGTVTTGDLVERVEYRFPAEIWQPLLEPQLRPVSSPITQLQLRVVADWQSIPFTELTTTNCDAFRRGSIKAVATAQQLSYTATDNASACSGAPLPILSTRQAGLLRFQGEHRQGRPLKFYLVTPGGQRAVLEEQVSPGRFDDVFGLLAWPGQAWQSYTLNWESRSFGSPTENALQQVAVLPLDLERLAQIQLRQTGQTARPNQVKLANNWKVGTYQYGTTAEVTTSPAILTLAQAYDPGWWGLAFPAEGGIRRLPQLEYNGWANAWLLPEGQYPVVIIYLPQLLQFAGGVTLVMTFVLLRYFRISNHS